MARSLLSLALYARPLHVQHAIISEEVSQLELLRPHHLLSDSEESLLQLGFEAERCMVRKTVSQLYAAGAHGCKRRYNKPAAAAFNPSVWDGGRNALVNYRIQSGSTNLSRSQFPGISGVNSAWLSRSRRGPTTVRRTIVDAEDSRVVHLRGKPFAVFSRYRGHKTRDMWLARLEEPYYERKLIYRARRHSEGNWLPFVHADQLYVSYSLCPHKVLAVDPGSGNCTLAYSTSGGGCRGYERGSAAGFSDDDGTVVGLGHGKGIGNGRFYWHFFFKRAATPPFAMIARSRDFRMPVYFAPFARRPTCCGNGNHTDAGSLWSIAGDFTQYCLSLRPRHNGTRDLVMDYSIRDVIPLSVHIPRPVFCNVTGWCNATRGGPRGRATRAARQTHQHSVSNTRTSSL